MIVVDASVVIEILLRTTAGIDLGDDLLGREESMCAPHLLDVEVAQVLRRYAMTGQLADERARESLSDLMALPIERFGHDLLLNRVWQLRDNLTAYDAVYVALAEALAATLVTRDERVANAPGHRASVELH